MMSLDNAVDLVFYAYQHARQGDIFIQKACACTIKTLAIALKELFHAKNEIKIIGTRHGEKKHETLLNREEMARAEDLGDYYRIRADSRDLSYNQYFTEGEQQISAEQDYNSSNTEQLDVSGIKKILMTVDYVIHAMKNIQGMMK
jgi:UDP-glucose 4-epimerase